MFVTSDAEVTRLLTAVLRHLNPSICPDERSSPSRSGSRASSSRSGARVSDRLDVASCESLDDGSSQLRGLTALMLRQLAGQLPGLSEDRTVALHDKALRGLEDDVAAAQPPSPSASVRVRQGCASRLLSPP